MMLRTQVETFIRQHGLLDSAAHLLVGFSGGADSTALLILLTELDVPLTAVHFHHGLRPAASDEARWCEAFCGSRQIPLLVEYLDVPAHRRPGEGMEEAARRCRLEAWQRLADEQAVVALGHHADDALEEMLLRLGRGSNASGLTGLRPSRTIAGVRLVRPLLCLRRNQVEAFLREEGVEGWCQDPSNQDTSLRRNAVRHQWLPVIRETLAGDGGLFQSLAALRQDADCLEQMAQSLVAKADRPAELALIPPALLPRVMRYWLQQRTGKDVILRHEAVARLQAELGRPVSAPRQIPLGDNLVLVLDRSGLRVRDQSAGLRPRVWVWQESPCLELEEAGAAITAELVDSVDPACKDPDVAYLAVDKMPAAITVRSRAAGDRLVPFGQHTARKLKDLFVQARIPQEQRQTVPVLEADGLIFWVPGVRRAEFGRVETGTEGEMVKLTYSRIESPGQTRARMPRASK